jgi:hypothetical protein
MEFGDHSAFLILAKLALHQRRWQKPLSRARRSRRRREKNSVRVEPPQSWPPQPVPTAMTR